MAISTSLFVAAMVITVIVAAVGIFIKECYRVVGTGGVAARTGYGGAKLINPGTGCLTIPGLQKLTIYPYKDTVFDVDSGWGVFYTSGDDEEFYLRFNLNVKPDHDLGIRAIKSFGNTYKNGYGDFNWPKIEEATRAIIIECLTGVTTGFSKAEIIQNPNALLTATDTRDKLCYSVRRNIIDGIRFKTGFCISSIIIKHASFKEEEELKLVSSSKDVSVNCPYCHDAIEDNDAIVRCDGCLTPHHAECFSDHQQCSTHACNTKSSAVRAKA